MVFVVGDFLFVLLLLLWGGGFLTILDPSLKQIVTKDIKFHGSCPERMDSHDLDLKPDGTLLLIKFHCDVLGLFRPWTPHSMQEYTLKNTWKPRQMVL